MNEEIKNKIQKFEKDLRKYNIFNTFDRSGIFQIFFELNFECKEVKEFLDKQYKKEQYDFDSFFGKDHQRADHIYIVDIFKGVFKSPMNLRKKIVKFMNKNNIDVLPYKKDKIVLYCDGRSEFNGNNYGIHEILSILRDLKRERLNCEVVFMSPANIEILEVTHTDFKKYYFKKKLPYKMKQEEIDEYIKLIDKAHVQELDQTESKRKDELKVKEDEERFGKIEYSYLIKNNEPLIIDKSWKLSELTKILNGLSLSLSSKIRRYVASEDKFKTGEFKYNKQINNISNFFSLLKEYCMLNIDEDIRETRKRIENGEEVDNNKLDDVINNICNFTLTLKDLFFMDMNTYLKEKNYKF